MTKIVFHKKGEDFVRIESEGHTGYANRGEDIVCAAVSALTQSTLNGLRSVLKAPVMFDIDDLQQFNNSFGSDRGNFLIRQIGQIIQESCKRDSDIVCRQNGGRFLVYIDGRDETYVSELADRTRAAVEGKRINHGRRASRPYVTLSVGIATGVPVEPSDIDVLCDEAENYLFGAKKLGKNCVVCDELLFGAYNRSMPRRGMYDEEINAV